MLKQYPRFRIWRRKYNKLYNSKLDLEDDKKKLLASEKKLKMENEVLKKNYSQEIENLKKNYSKIVPNLMNILHLFLYLISSAIDKKMYKTEKYLH